MEYLIIFVCFLVLLVLVLGVMEIELINFCYKKIFMYCIEKKRKNCLKLYISILIYEIMVL